MNSYGNKHVIKTLPSGKKVRQTISPTGRIIKVTPLKSRINRTRSGKSLNRRRRRIYR